MLNFRTYGRYQHGGYSPFGNCNGKPEESKYRKLPLCQTWHLTSSCLHYNRHIGSPDCPLSQSLAGKLRWYYLSSQQPPTPFHVANFFFLAVFLPSWLWCDMWGDRRSNSRISWRKHTKNLGFFCWTICKTRLINKIQMFLFLTGYCNKSSFWEMDQFLWGQD